MVSTLPARSEPLRDVANVRHAIERSLREGFDHTVQGHVTAANGWSPEVDVWELPEAEETGPGRIPVQDA